MVGTFVGLGDEKAVLLLQSDKGVHSGISFGWWEASSGEEPGRVVSITPVWKLTCKKVVHL